MRKFKLSLVIYCLFIVSSVCSAAIVTGARALQIESDKSTFFSCSVLGYVKNSQEIISLESKRLSKYELKNRDEETGNKGVYFNLFDTAGFATFIESEELYLVSEIDDTGEVDALAFKEAPAFLELNAFIEASVNEKSKKFRKFSIDCGKSA